MKPNDAFAKCCMIGIVLLLTVIACRQSGPTGVQAAADVEYFMMPLNTNPNQTFIQLSERLNSAASELGGKLHTIESLGMGTSYIAVLEVPKGTLAKVNSQVQK